MIPAIHPLRMIRVAPATTVVIMTTAPTPMDPTIATDPTHTDPTAHTAILTLTRHPIATTIITVITAATPTRT